MRPPCRDTLHYDCGRRGEVKVGVRMQAALAGAPLMSVSLGSSAQVGENRQLQMPQTSKVRSAGEPDSQAEEELQKGTSLTRTGSLSEGNPPLLPPRGTAS